MRSFIVLTTCSAFMMFLLSCKQKPDNEEPNVLPAVKEWIAAKGYAIYNNKAIIVEDQVLQSIATTFSSDIHAVSGAIMSVVSTKQTEGIVLRLDTSKVELGVEGYTIKIDDIIEVVAPTPKGVFYATQTLLQMIKQDTLQQGLPKGTIIDMPTIAQRCIMMDVARKYYEVDYLKKTIRNMAWYKMNILHLHFTDWNAFRLQSDQFPGLASPQSYSKQVIRELQDYAKQYNVMIVAEIDLPAHATHIIRYKPNFAFSCPSMRQVERWLPDSVNKENVGWVLNMTKPEVRTFIADLLKEFIPLFDAPYFHVGGDEWPYDVSKYACPELMAYAAKKGYPYPGDVFVEWINEINTLVKSFGKQTQIWSWWSFNPNAEKQNVTSIHPDKDIIVNVWNAPNEKTILDDGYQVIITPEEGDGALYITPGENGTKPGDYGFFDSKRNYEQWQPRVTSQIEGYKVCIWADKIEKRSDEWVEAFTVNPKAVFAEKTWGKQASLSYEDFIERMKKVGLIMQ